MSSQSSASPDTAVAVNTRWLIRRDFPEVMEIERAGFGRPWTEEEFLLCLRQRSCIGMVAERGEKILGFMLYELCDTKLHVLNFAVHPAHRRQGVGATMIGRLKAKPSSHRRNRVTLEMRETNLGAQLFFRAQGFRATRVLRRFYEDSGEDAFLMSFVIPGGDDDDEIDFDAVEVINRVFPAP